MAKSSGDRFTELLKRLVRVPKQEIDEQERLYQGSKREPAKAREIVKPPRKKAG